MSLRSTEVRPVARLLQVANGRIGEQLMAYGIQFMCQEPNVCIESPVAI